MTALRINPDDLTLGDLEDFEDYVGKPLGKAIREEYVLDEDGKRVLDEKGRPEKEVVVGSKALVALVWLTKRQDDPDYTIDQARKVKVTHLIYGPEGESDPT